MNYIEEERRKEQLNQKLADLVESLEPAKYENNPEYIDLKSFIDFMVTQPRRDGNLYYYVQGHEDRYTPYDVEEIVYYQSGKIKHVIYDHGVPYYESTIVVTDTDEVVEVVDTENYSPIVPQKISDEEIIEYYKANKVRDFDLSLNNDNLRINGDLNVPFGNNTTLDLSNPWNYEFRSPGMFYDYYKADNKLVTELLKRLYVKISDCPEMIQSSLRDIKYKKYSINQVLNDYMYIKDKHICIANNLNYFRPMLLSDGSIYAQSLCDDAVMPLPYDGPIILIEKEDGNFQEILTKTDIGFGEDYKEKTIFVPLDITDVHIEDVTQLGTILRKLYEGKEYDLAKTMDYLSTRFVECEKKDEEVKPLIEKAIEEFKQAELERIREEKIILPEDIAEDSLRELAKGLDSLPAEQRAKYAQDIKNLNEYYIEYKDFFTNEQSNSITSNMYYQRVASLREDMSQYFNKNITL